MSNIRLALAATGGVGAIASALMLATPMVEKWEGTKLDPYKDIGGLLTVCTGETRVPMRRYTPVECKTLLDKTLAREFAPAVLKTVPSPASTHAR